MLDPDNKDEMEALSLALQSARQTGEVNGRMSRLVEIVEAVGWKNALQQIQASTTIREAHAIAAAALNH